MFRSICRNLCLLPGLKNGAKSFVGKGELPMIGARTRTRTRNPIEGCISYMQEKVVRSNSMLVFTRSFSSRKKSSETEFALENMIEKKVDDQVSNNNGEKLTDRGVVVDLKEGYAICSGLRNASLNQLVYFIDSNNTVIHAGLVISLEDISVRVSCLESTAMTTELLLGSTVCTLQSLPNGTRIPQKFPFKIPESISNEVRLINPLGYPIDLEGNPKEDRIVRFQTDESTLDVFPHESETSAFVKTRDRIKNQLYTGIRIFDILYPMGAGERVSWSGEHGLKKRHLAKILVNNLSENQIDQIIWVSIGQTLASVKGVVKSFEASKVPGRATIISAAHTEPWGLQWVAPYAGVTLGEHLMKQGKNVFIVLEGMSEYGAAHLQYSTAQGSRLSSHSQPHAVFLERFANLKDSGSMSALCIFDTDNTMQSDRMRDSIYGTVDTSVEFDRKPFLQRRLNPSIDCMSMGKCSVKPFQHKAIAELTIKLKDIMYELAQLKDNISKASQIGINLEHEMDLSIDLAHQQKIEAFFCKSDLDKKYEVAEQIIQLYAVSNKALENVKESNIEAYLDKLVEKSKNKRFNEHSGDSVEPKSLYEVVGNLKPNETVSDYMKLSSEMKDLLASSFED